MPNDALRPDVVLFLRDVVASTLALESESVDVCASLTLLPQWDSVAALSVLLSLEDKYGMALDPAGLFESGSVSGMARFLCDYLAETSKSLPDAARQM